MEIFLFAISVILLLSFTFSIIYGGKVAEVCSKIIKYLLIVLFTICVCGIITISNPRAIDVYRGKTTLEITYKDSIPIDSVVVFK